MEAYKRVKARSTSNISDKYKILGFISSGTYGKVYKAQTKNRCSKIVEEVAIKQFKPEGDSDKRLPSGISQSACREIAICRELCHINVVFLKDVMIENNQIHMIMNYSEYDLLTIFQYHKRAKRPLTELVIKSVLYQLISGVNYLHENGIMHRDIKPANLLIDKNGLLKVGDLGLARLYSNQYMSLYSGDKVVVTIWYRAPELILGTRHYTRSIDVWAIGCVFGELLTLRPMFNGEELRIEPKKPIPFQKSQMLKICEILGSPNTNQWPDLDYMPEFSNFKKLKNYPVNFRTWFQNSLLKYDDCFKLLSKMLEYDPKKRISAESALQHPFFKNEPYPVLNPCTKKISENQGYCLICNNNFSLEQTKDLDFNNIQKRALNLQQVLLKIAQQKHKPGIDSCVKTDKIPSFPCDIKLNAKLQTDSLKMLQDINSSQSSNSSYEIPTQSEVISLYLNKKRSVVENLNKTEQKFVSQDKPRSDGLDKNITSNHLDMSKCDSLGLNIQQDFSTQNTANNDNVNILYSNKLNNSENVTTKLESKSSSLKKRNDLDLKSDDKSESPEKKNGSNKKQKLFINNTKDIVQNDLNIVIETKNSTDILEPQYSSSMSTSSSFTASTDKVVIMISGLSENDKKWLTNYNKKKKNKLEYSLVDDVQAIIKSYEKYKTLNKAIKIKRKTAKDSLAQTLLKNTDHNGKIEITHLIVGVDKNNLASRTFKYLLGIVTGAHIVTIKWLRDSVKAGEMLDEKDYYINHDRYIVSGFNKLPERSGPYYGRLSKLGLVSKVFDNYIFILANKLKLGTSRSENYLINSSISEISFLLNLGGGIVSLATEFCKILKKLDFNPIECENLEDFNSSAEYMEIVKHIVTDCFNPSGSSTSNNFGFKLVFVVDDDKIEEFTDNSINKINNLNMCPSAEFIIQTNAVVKPVKWIFDSISIYQAQMNTVQKLAAFKENYKLNKHVELQKNADPIFSEKEESDLNDMKHFFNIGQEYLTELKLESNKLDENISELQNTLSLVEKNQLGNDEIKKLYGIAAYEHTLVTLKDIQKIKPDNDQIHDFNKNIDESQKLDMEIDSTQNSAVFEDINKEQHAMDNNLKKDNMSDAKNISNKEKMNFDSITHITDSNANNSIEILKNNDDITNNTIDSSDIYQDKLVSPENKKVDFDSISTTVNINKFESATENKSIINDEPVLVKQEIIPDIDTPVNNQIENSKSKDSLQTIDFLDCSLNQDTKNDILIINSKSKEINICSNNDNTNTLNEISDNKKASSECGLTDVVEIEIETVNDVKDQMTIIKNLKSDLIDLTDEFGKDQTDDITEIDILDSDANINDIKVENVSKFKNDAVDDKIIDSGLSIIVTDNDFYDNQNQNEFFTKLKPLNQDENQEFENNKINIKDSDIEIHKDSNNNKNDTSEKHENAEKNNHSYDDATKIQDENILIDNNGNQNQIDDNSSNQDVLVNNNVIVLVTSNDYTSKDNEKIIDGDEIFTNEHDVEYKESNTQPQNNFLNKNNNQIDVQRDNEDTKCHDECENLDVNAIDTEQKLLTPETKNLQQSNEVQQKRWKKNIANVWMDIYAHRLGGVFASAIKDSDAPKYSEAIKFPLDLKLIKNKIRDNEIKSTNEFYRDIMLMLQNALMYNREDSEVYKMAMEFIPDARVIIEQLSATEFAFSAPNIEQDEIFVSNDQTLPLNLNTRSNTSSIDLKTPTLKHKSSGNLENEHSDFFMHTDKKICNTDYIDSSNSLGITGLGLNLTSDTGSLSDPDMGDFTDSSNDSLGVKSELETYAEAQNSKNKSLHVSSKHELKSPLATISPKRKRSSLKQKHNKV
ncbi:hypothetical protein BB561_005165 [Smittium simulii]|uniref:Cyclin-dependent kinase 8 n=1 Tax=Smittium simulii TaxID=133385 RepID=A0A2T9YBV0_9FUNG|nr:hypothetical protein BB561_005165 [Smittium simulii]